MLLLLLEKKSSTFLFLSFLKKTASNGAPDSPAATGAPIEPGEEEEEEEEQGEEERGEATYTVVRNERGCLVVVGKGPYPSFYYDGEQLYFSHIGALLRWLRLVPALARQEPWAIALFVSKQLEVSHGCSDPFCGDFLCCFLESPAVNQSRGICAAIPLEEPCFCGQHPQCKRFTKKQAAEHDRRVTTEKQRRTPFDAQNMVAQVLAAFDMLVAIEASVPAAQPGATTNERDWSPSTLPCAQEVEQWVLEKHAARAAQEAAAEAEAAAAQAGAPSGGHGCCRGHEGLVDHGGEGGAAAAAGAEGGERDGVEPAGSPPRDVDARAPGEELDENARLRAENERLRAALVGRDAAIVEKNRTIEGLTAQVAVLHGQIKAGGHEPDA